MSGLNFTNKTLRHASDLRPDELPPVVGKGRIFVAFDDLTAGLPQGEEEVQSAGKEPEPKK